MILCKIFNVLLMEAACVLHSLLLSCDVLLKIRIEFSRAYVLLFVRIEIGTMNELQIIIEELYSSVTLATSVSSYAVV